MPGSSSTRVRAALALACALHTIVLAGVYAWGGQWGRPSKTVAVIADDLEVAIEPELEPALLPAPAQVASASSVAASEHTPPARLARATPQGNASSELGAGDEAKPASPEVAGEPTEGDAVLAPAPAPDRVVDLGLGPRASLRWARLGQVEPPAKPKSHQRSGARAAQAPPVSTTGGLLEGLEAHDRRLGLGPSGPVISALYRAAHAPEAPRLGAARFEVTVLKTGSVEVALVGATDQLAAWSKVGALAAESIRKAPPRIAEPRSGTRMVIAIVAEEVFPNGTKRKDLYGTRLEVAGPKLRSTSDAQDKLKELNPVSGDTGAPVTGQPLILEIPGVYVAAHGAICSYRLGITPFGPVLAGGCDPGNAKAQRMVSTQVESQAMF